MAIIIGLKPTVQPYISESTSICRHSYHYVEYEMSELQLNVNWCYHLLLKLHNNSEYQNSVGKEPFGKH